MIPVILLLLFTFCTYNLFAGAQLYIGLNLMRSFRILIGLLSMILIQYGVFKIFLKNVSSKKLLIASFGSNVILIFLGFLLSFINRFFMIIPIAIFLQSPLLVSLIMSVWVQYFFIHYLVLPDLSFEKIIYPLVVSNFIIYLLLYVVIAILYFLHNM